MAALRNCLRLLVLIALLAVPAVLAAQETAPAGSADQPAASAAASDDSATADSGEAEAAPPYPAGLDNPDIDLAALQYKLLPLTVEQLDALAKAWQAIVQEQTQAVVDATIEARLGNSNPTPEQLQRIVDLTEIRGRGFARYKAVIDNFEKKGGDPAVIATLRSYRSAISFEEKQRADWRTLGQMVVNWATSPDGGIKLAKNVLVIVGAMLVLLIVARMVRGYARRLFERVPDLSKLLQAFLAMVVYWITIAIGLMIVLSALGIDISPVFALIGGASFIMAFAMQDTLGNLAAGLMIMINRPFDEGDYITAGGTSGTVKSVSVVSTTVATPDNQVIVIPNSKVWGDVITNTTASDVRRVDMQFGIGYDDSIEEAQEVLERVVNGHPLVLEDPAPVIRVGSLGDSSVNFVVRPWARRDDYWTVLWDLNRLVKEAFDAQGISIPFPQTDMNIKVAGVAAAALPAAMAAQAGAADQGTGAAKGAPDYKSGDDGDPQDDGDESDQG